jgi:hypothetical protein
VSAVESKHTRGENDTLEGPSLASVYILARVFYHATDVPQLTNTNRHTLELHEPQHLHAWGPVTPQRQAVCGHAESGSRWAQ